MIVSSGFNLLFRPGLRKDFRTEYNMYEPEWMQFLKAGTTSDEEGSATIFAYINRLYERGEGEPFIFTQPKIGPKVMWVNKEFAGGYQITKRAVLADKYNVLKTGAKQLARAAQLTKEYRAGGFLDDLFTGTYYKGIDNLAFMSTAHTIIGSAGTTLSNKLSTAVGLSMTSLTSMMDLFGQLKDENNDPIKSWPDKIIIGNDAGNQNKIIQLLGSQLEPFTADNQDNPLKKRFSGLTPIVSRYMTNPRWYFMIDSKLNDMHLDVRVPLELRDWYDEYISAMLVSASEMYSLYGVDWRGWVGTNPT